MPIWDIIGPVMIGPSSSHTAGAVRIGRLARMCWGGELKKADIYMRGSFASTGLGHGTDKALVAGLLGYNPDDTSVRYGIDLARKAKLDYHFHVEDIEGAHPNSVRIVMSDDRRSVEVVAASIGGGAVILQQLDGFQVDITGSLPVVVIINKDVHGVVGAVSTYFAGHGVNIATMKVNRSGRGGMATMVIELDPEGARVTIDEIKAVHPAIERVIGIRGVE
ncbi:MAG: L-serine ammonia-lyase, iron-sulfur-dependent subunit beta [Synergistaceae bacterium]|nr:L-serine ammonia-lyase, iron-sulfur-dependent subunit beta [Synergistaceae bacterium]